MKLATLVYLKKDGKTLMMHRVKKDQDMHEGKWNGLGGKFEPGEAPEACAIREIKEETGLDIANPTMKGILTFPAHAGREDWYVFAFVATDISGEMIDSVEGNLSWIPDKELPTLNTWEGDKLFMPLLDQPGQFSARFLYNDDEVLVDHSISTYND